MIGVSGKKLMERDTYKIEYIARHTGFDDGPRAIFEIEPIDLDKLVKYLSGYHGGAWIEITSVKLFKKGIGYKEVQKMNNLDTIKGQFEISMSYLKSVKALEGSDDWVTLKDREEFMKLNDAIMNLLGYLEIRNGKEIN